MGFSNFYIGNTPPHVSVNIVIFDKNYNFLDAAFSQISTSAQQVGVSPVVPHDYLTKEYTIKEGGYAFLYIVNENATQVDAYFDDVKMTYTPGNVMQSSEYYPFGMQTASSWTRDNVTGNNFLGNGGTELNTTSQVYDLDYRNYDPILGRMNQVDPLADQFSSLSPYHYSYNNPIGFNDPSGALPWSADFAESYTGSDYGSRNAWAKMVAHGGMSQFVGGAGEGWDGYVGGFGLADGGFGFGSMYSNPSAIVDANYGAEQAAKMFTYKGKSITVGTRYENPSSVRQYSPQDGQNSGIGGLLYVGANGNLLGYTRATVKKGSDGGWISVSSTGVVEFQTQDRSTLTYAGIAGNGDYSLLDVMNFSLGTAGAVMNSTAAQLYKDRAALVAGRYSRQAVRGVETIDNSLAGLSKTARNLGYAGLLLNGGSLTYSYFNDGITASQAFDFAVGIGLTVLTVTNPALLIGFGVYGLLDAAGTFDGIKESLGGDTVILKH